MTNTTETVRSGMDPVQAAKDVANIAATYANEVDRAARFPAEAVQAMRERRLLAAAAPPGLGGLGCPVRTLVDIAQALAHGCASTAMTWAMHQIQLACLVRHGHNTYLRRYTERVCHDQLLLASATSEAGVGGDIRTSRAAVTAASDRLFVEKEASTISYGADADGVLATLRRAPDAAPTDQVLVMLHADETTLEQRSEWNALGMRGTCSAGFRIRASIRPEQILPGPFEPIATATMVPFSNILWAACWIGIAASAAGRAREYVRLRERKSVGRSGAAPARLARAYGRLRLAGALVSSAAAIVDARSHHIIEEPDTRPSDWITALDLNDVKVAASEIAVEVTQEALNICGFAGYQEQGPYSVGRHLRDVLSAPLMVANERLLATNGGLLVSRKEARPLW